MPRLRRCHLALAVVFFAAAVLGSSTAAQESANLVVNGTFVSSLAGWDPAQGLAEWSPESASPDGTGSARLTGNHPSGGAADTVLLQCVLVSPGAHLLQLRMRVPSGQLTTGAGYAIAYAYANTVCTDAPVAGSFYTPDLRSSSWSGGWAAVQVPAGAASVSIRLVVLKDQAGGELDVLADAVQLTTGLLFADGFGSGTTAQWSATVP